MVELYLHDIEIKNVSSNPKSDFPDTSEVRLYCCDGNGEPVYVKVQGFRTWFFLEAPDTLPLDDIKTELSELWWAKSKNTFEVVERQRLVGFTDNKKFKYLKVSFKGNIPMFSARKHLRNEYPNVKIYEDTVEPNLKFFHSTGVKPSSYFKISGYTSTFGYDKGVSVCEQEYTVNVADIKCVNEERPPPPMVILSYDLECSGLRPENDFIFQVSMCYSKLGENLNTEETANEHASSACKDGVVICVGETDSIDGTPIKCVANEKELLEEFRRQIISRKVMILTGYNTYQYDSMFLYRRALEVYHYEDFRKLGFIRDDKIELVNKVLASSALGRTELSRMIIPGRVEVDALMVLRRTSKLKSYKLNSVCNHFFGGEKDDVTYGDILEACREKDPNKLGIVARYCYQDSFLVLRLIDKIKEVYNCVQMANLCTVPLTYILGRGQQIKCFSLILDKIYGKYVCNYVPNSRDASYRGNGTEEDGFQGATVIDAKTGFYPDDPIVCMDFASLYPSIMRWKQLCYTTYVNDDTYRNIEGVYYEDYETSKGRIDTFAYRPGEKSVLCALEDFLIDERKKTKKEMKGEKDPFRYSLLDSKQLAQKVTCNSLYGFTGTNYGMLPLKAIAAAVTCTGRTMIEQTSAFAEKEFGCNTVYGDTDSVMVIFPVPNEIKSKGDTATMKYLFKKGEEASAKITGIFGHPVLLEFENIYTRYLLVSKKRYAGLSWLKPEGPPSMCMKGLVTVRRDNAPIVSKCATKLLDLLLFGKKSNKEIEDYVKSVLDDLEHGRVPMEDLIIRKELTKWEYANPVPHAVLAKKMVERSKNQRFFRDYVKPCMENADFDYSKLHMIWTKVNGLKNMIPSKRIEEMTIEEFVAKLRGKTLGKTGDFKNHPLVLECETLVDKNALYATLISGGIVTKKDVSDYYMENSSYDVIDWDSPRLGDRIPYVVTRGKGELNGRVEDPNYVSKIKNIHTDNLYYIARQLKNPLTDLMDHFMDKNRPSIFEEYEVRANNVNMGVREITSFFTSTVKRSGGGNPPPQKKKKR